MVDERSGQSVDAPARHPNRAARFWRCPGCGLDLIVIEDRGHVIFQHRGKLWKRCPSCRLRGLNKLYRAARKGS